MAGEMPPKFVDLWTAASTRIGSEVNIIGVLSDFLPAKKSSGTDWTCSFSLADRTHGYVGEVGQEGLRVRFFKKLQDELPQIWGTGDVMILRNMKIKQFSGLTLAISSYGSTWTVIHASSIPDKAPSNLVVLPHVKETTAPTPTPGDIRYAIDVCNHFNRHFYTSKGAPAPMPPDQTRNLLPTANMMPRQKFSLIKDVQIATFYDLVGQVVKIFPSNGRTDLYITDYTPNQLLYFYQWGQDEDELEAREGDEFGYVSRFSRNAKKWPGPFGKLTLPVTLWSPHAEYAQQHVKEGDFVFLRNTHIRLDQDTKLVGSLHLDRRYVDRIDISILTNFDDDDRVKDVLRRKKDYHKKFDQQSEKIVIETRETKTVALKEANRTKNENVKPLSRNQIRKRRKQEKQTAHLAQSKTSDQPPAKRRRSHDTETEPPSSFHDTPASSPPPKKAPKLESKFASNENIKCSNHLHPIVPLSTVISVDNLIHKSPQRTTYTLPFQNINTRVSVRAVDFWPSRLEDFAVRKRKASEYSVLSDYDESDSESESSNREEILQSHIAASARRDRCESNKRREGEIEDEEPEWEWRFALLLEDATNNARASAEEIPTLKAYVCGPDAECLLKLDAENLHDSPIALEALREKLFLLWGNLEERKRLAKEAEARSLNEIDSNGQNSSKMKSLEVKGRPFQCCLKEYGVAVKTENVDVEIDCGNAGDGDESGRGRETLRWVRMWRMWGCTIT